MTQMPLLISCSPALCQLSSLLIPPYKQRHTKKRLPPKPRNTPAESVAMPQPTKKNFTLQEEHCYSVLSLSVEEKLESTKQQLPDVCKELKNVKQKVKRRDAKISSLLQDVKDQNLINHGQLDLLKLNFGDNTFSLIEIELKAQDVNKHGHRYSEDLKQGVT